MDLPSGRRADLGCLGLLDLDTHARRRLDHRRRHHLAQRRDGCWQRHWRDGLCQRQRDHGRKLSGVGPLHQRRSVLLGAALPALVPGPYDLLRAARRELQPIGLLLSPHLRRRDVRGASAARRRDAGRELPHHGAVRSPGVLLTQRLRRLQRVLRAPSRGGVHAGQRLRLWQQVSEFGLLPGSREPRCWKPFMQSRQRLLQRELRRRIVQLTPARPTATLGRAEGPLH